MSSEYVLCDLLKDYKIINDNIHGSITLSKLANLIVDTPEFQRLRYIKQLSTCYFVFPNAVHTRFEHSLGTYQICKKMLYNLKKNSKKEELNVIKNIQELKSYFINKNNTTYMCDTDDFLDDFIIELIAIGALCHDLGHGPFSHLFDDNFLKNKENIKEENKYHENRSCKILDIIIKRNDTLNHFINQNEINFISNIINPDPQIHKDYVYQIVSNSLNSIDVDKFDYLTRDSKMLNINISFDFTRLIESAMVINNVICYPKKVDSDIINLFQTRHYLHKKVYSHKSVISSLLLIIELLENLDKLINFTQSVEKLDQFINYTDDYILNICRFIIHNKIYNLDYDKERIDRIKYVIECLDSHRFYPMIYSNYIDPSSKDDKFYNILFNKIDENNIVKFESVIGFISGKKNNPLDSVYLYKSKDPYEKLQILTESESARLLPNKYQEKLIMIFYKDTTNIDKIKELRIKFN